MKLSDVKTPCYVIDEGALIHNLEILKKVEDESGAHILLAQKCFSGYDEYPLIAKYISGTTGSGLYEARLGHEKMGVPYGKQTHVYAPAYKSEDIPELARICDHMIFNSSAQLLKHYNEVRWKTSIGVRINPQYRTQKDHPMYDPCAPGSRLGMKKEDLTPDILAKIDGIHFHTMCEQRFDDLAKTVRVVERDFGDVLRRVKWLNMGGGQHITSEGYDVEGLITLIKHLRETYNIDVYLEPGEAVTIDAGILVSEVLDVVENRLKVLVLDASAACHMPDVLEVPYTPTVSENYVQSSDSWEKPQGDLAEGYAGKPQGDSGDLAEGYAGNQHGDSGDLSEEYAGKPQGGSGDEIVFAGEPAEKNYTYRLAGNTCLAGDVIGDYSFDTEKKPGDRLYFHDMAIYSMVKNNTFNGIPLPSIYAMDKSGECRLLKEFGYEDFKSRLGS
ncbi:MAG: carboxynorspermidine decarboxylase [Lachnospiraceae bacterium]|nr:carboxynorspermidine decarboxylase [Lachnospiraceae bacterium]